MRQLLAVVTTFAILAIIYNAQLLKAEAEEGKKEGEKAAETKKKDGEDAGEKKETKKHPLEEVAKCTQCGNVQKNLEDLVVMYRRVLKIEETMEQFVTKVVEERNATKEEIKKMQNKIKALEAAAFHNYTVLWNRTEELYNLTKKGKPVKRDAYSIVCYYDDYQTNGEATFLPEDIDPKLCTDIVYNSAELEEKTLRIVPKYPKLDLGEKFYRRVTSLKKFNPKLRVYLSLGGWEFKSTGVYSRLIGDSKMRKTFVSHVVCFLRDYNFDGLNLLWSFPACGMKACSSDSKKDKTNFVSFLADLRESFDGVQPPLLLSARVAAFPSVISEVYNAPSMSRLLDLIHVETPFYCQRRDVTCHSSPLFKPNMTEGTPPISVDDSIQHWIKQGVPSKKLIITIETYGRKFLLEKSYENKIGSSSVGRQGNPRFREICENVRRPGWTIVYVPSVGTYAHKGNQWIAYEDPISVMKKAEYVKDMNLGGIAIQNIQYDDQGATCCNTSYPLLNVAQRVLLGQGKDLKEMDCPVGSYNITE